MFLKRTRKGQMIIRLLALIQSIVETENNVLVPLLAIRDDGEVRL